LYPLLLFPTTHNHAVGPFVHAGLVALGRHAPRGHGVATAGGAALAASVRVIDRVHSYTANRRPYATPARGPRFTEGTQGVRGVAHLTASGLAIRVPAPYLAGPQPERRVTALARDDLHRGTSTAGQLSAFARLHLHTMNERADRNHAQWQRIANLDRGIR